MAYSPFTKQGLQNQLVNNIIGPEPTPAPPRTRRTPTEDRPGGTSQPPIGSEPGGSGFWELNNPAPRQPIYKQDQNQPTAGVHGYPTPDRDAARFDQQRRQQEQRRWGLTPNQPGINYYGRRYTGSQLLPTNTTAPGMNIGTQPGWLGHDGINYTPDPNWDEATQGPRPGRPGGVSWDVHNQPKRNPWQSGPYRPTYPGYPSPSPGRPSPGYPSRPYPYPSHPGNPSPVPDPRPPMQYPPQPAPLEPGLQPGQQIPEDVATLPGTGGPGPDATAPEAPEPYTGTTKKEHLAAWQSGQLSDDQLKKHIRETTMNKYRAAAEKKGMSFENYRAMQESYRTGGREGLDAWRAANPDAEPQRGRRPSDGRSRFGYQTREQAIAERRPGQGAGYDAQGNRIRSQYGLGSSSYNPQDAQRNWARHNGRS